MLLPHPRTRPSGMVPNPAKVREAILRIIRDNDRHDVRMTGTDILQTLFVADRAHLNRYGRPITFDEYIATREGPVGSLAFGILNGETEAQGEAAIDRPLWRSTAIGEGTSHHHRGARAASQEVLSPSDFEELDLARRQVRKWGAGRTSDEVRCDPAYLSAWTGGGDEDARPIDYALLLDVPSPNFAEDLKFIAAHS